MSSKYQLPNGLTVILNESHKSPVVSVQMWVRTGSADERKGEEGISHFIEHLVFKGTDKFGVGDIAATVEGSGGELNAYTSFDQTVFYVTISKAFEDTALEVVSQMMGFPSFVSEEIDNEREVVIEEIKRGNDSAGRCASRLLFSTAYKKHPYSLPVIGFDKVIRKVSRKTMVDYFQSRYVPKNMFLVVSGDFAKPEMKKKVKKYFGPFVDHRLRKVKRSSEEKQESLRLKVEESSFEEAHVHMGWKIPKVQHKDIPALDVLGLILGQGDSSRLVRRLRLDEPVVNYIYSGTFNPLDRGLFIISAALNSQNFSTLLPQVFDEVLKLRRDFVSEQELEKAITNMEAEEYYGMETVDGLSRKYGHLEFSMGDHKYFPKYMKQIQSVTREDVRKVARKYLKLDNLTFTVLASEGDNKKDLQKLVRGELKAFKKALDNKSKAPVEKAMSKKLKRKKRSLSAKNQGTSPLEVISLPGGAKCLLQPSREVPCLSARTAHLGGIRLESSEKTGMTELLSRTWLSGSKSFSESEIHQKLDDWASSIHAFGGRNTVGLSLDGLKSFEGELAELYSEMLMAPTFSEDVVEREKTVMREMIKARDDNPAQKAILQFMQTLFGQHPYSRDPKGTHETLERISSDDIRSHWQRMSHPSNFVTVVTGDVDVDLWKDQLSKTAERLSPGDTKAETFAHPNQSEDSEQFITLEKEQTHVVTGVKGLTFKSEQRYALELIQAILAGQGGRLFIELRDKKSLAYSVAPLKMEGIDTGYFATYIGCSPEKAAEAIRMLRQELDRLAEVSVPEEELQRAKRYLIGRHDIDLQKNSALANSLLFDEVYGIDHDEIFNYPKYIQGVSSEQVKSLASDLFSQKFVTVAVGASSPF